MIVKQIMLCATNKRERMHTSMTINHVCACASASAHAFAQNIDMCVHNIFSNYIRLQGNNWRISVTPKAQSLSPFYKMFVLSPPYLC